MRRPVPLAAVLTAVILAPALPAQPHGPAAVERTLSHDGRERTYLVHDFAREVPAPVVVVLHGGGGNAENAVRMTGIGDEAPPRAPMPTFIVVGATDTVVPPDGGSLQLRALLGRRSAADHDVAPALAQATYWATHNGCSPPVTTETARRRHPGDGLQRQRRDVGVLQGPAAPGPPLTATGSGTSIVRGRRYPAVSRTACVTSY